MSNILLLLLRSLSELTTDGVEQREVSGLNPAVQRLDLRIRNVAWLPIEVEIGRAHV